MKKTLSEFKDEIENILIFIENLDLFNPGIHCKIIKEFLINSTKYLKDLNDNERNKIAKITKFHKEKCKRAVGRVVF